MQHARPIRAPTYAETSSALDLCEICDAVFVNAAVPTKQKVDAAVETVRTSCKSSSASELASSLCMLAAELMHGLPFKVTLDAMTALQKCKSAPIDLLVGAAPLWPAALNHQNRDVRVTALFLLTRLCMTAAAELSDFQAMAAIFHSRLHLQLGALLTGFNASTAVQALAALALRGLMRAPHIAATCRAEDGTGAGLASSLQTLQSSARQGALSCQVQMLLLHLGHLGAPSELGERLATSLKLDDASATEDEEDEEDDESYYDAVMVFPSGTLLIHRVLLAARAPVWLELLERASQGAQGDDRDGRRRWILSADEADALPHAACRALYSLVASGRAWVPAEVRPKALRSAVERLGLKPLLVAPPCDAHGTTWLSLHLAAAAGGLAGFAEVRFELRDGVLPGHMSLLAAGSDYFRTLFSFQRRSAAPSARREPQAVSVDAGVAAFSRVLQYVYAGILPSTASPRSGRAKIRAGETTVPAPSTEAPKWAPPPPVDAADRAFGAEVGATWDRLQEEADAADAWLRERIGAMRGKTDAATAVAGASLGAWDGLELVCLANRYMLEPLARAALEALTQAMDADVHRSATDFVSLLLRAQEDCETVACEAIFGWAVQHYDLVHAQLDLWCTCSPSALPPSVRPLGEHGLRELSEALRAAMLRERHGL